MVSGLEKQPTTANGLDHCFANNAEIKCGLGTLGTLWSLVRVKTTNYAGRSRRTGRTYKKDLPPHLGRQSQDFKETGTFFWTILMGDVFDHPLHMLLKVF